MLINYLNNKLDNKKPQKKFCIQYVLNCKTLVYSEIYIPRKCN